LEDSKSSVITTTLQEQIIKKEFRITSLIIKKGFGDNIPDKNKKHADINP
tara:strand:- start:1552 stop:1701 length:150 start_codon:yes stop_codon:yes gene_type:complete